MAVDNPNVCIKIYDDVMKFSSQNYLCKVIAHFYTNIVFIHHNLTCIYIYVALINASAKANGRGCFYLPLARSREGNTYAAYPGYPYSLCYSCKEEALGSSGVTFISSSFSATRFHPSCWKLLCTFNASSPRPEEGSWMFLLFSTNMFTFFGIFHFFFSSIMFLDATALRFLVSGGRVWNAFFSVSRDC